MKKTLLVAPLLILALAACGKKEEAVSTLPQPATPPTLPAAASPADTSKPADTIPLAPPAAAPAAPAPAPAGQETQPK